MRYLAIDPGSHKSGIAIAESSPQGLELLHREVVDLDNLLNRLTALFQQFQLEVHLIGSGTGSKSLLAQLKAWFPSIQWELVNERDSTLEARRKYFQFYPPRGWRKWIPQGLLLPPVPYDDFVALILIERYLQANSQK
ncbi:MAG: resolvase [Fimbriimonadia bacterium]|nr:resolvase [Fimbriimonadia bacterium]